MKRVIIFLFSFLLVSVAFAQNDRSTSKVGTTAAQFLKIGAGARAIGMGGAYTAIGGDLYSLYWNPAGIAESRDNGQVVFNHAEWLADIKYDFAAGAIRLEDFGTFAVTLTSLGVPEDKVTTMENPEGDGRVFDASSLAIGFGFAKELTDRFSIGFHAKYVREAIWNMSASGFGIDVGTLYRTPFNDLKIGASITNFGSKMQLDGSDIQFNDDPNNDDNSGPNNISAKYNVDSYDMPLTFRVGLSMDVLNTSMFRVTAAVDAAHPNDNTEYMNTGVELAYDELIFVRGGYKSLFLRDSEQSFTLGAGLNYRITSQMRIFVNYGYADYGRLENVQFIDIGLTF
jgi:opacity protein-like surface antigen